MPYTFETKLFSDGAIHAFLEAAENAWWRGEFLRERRKDLGKPGEFYESLPEAVKAKMRGMTSDEFANVRIDAIAFMLHPPRFQ